MRSDHTPAQDEAFGPVAELLLWSVSVWTLAIVLGVIFAYVQTLGQAALPTLGVSAVVVALTNRFLNRVETHCKGQCQSDDYGVKTVHDVRALGADVQRPKPEQGHCAETWQKEICNQGYSVVRCTSCGTYEGNPCRKP